MPIILATQPIDDYCRRTLERFAPIRIATDMLEATLLVEARDAIAIVVRGQAPITPQVIACAPNLKVIGRTGVGYDTVNIPAATAHGVPVVYAPGAGARAVAEGTFTFMLAMCKKLQYWDGAMKSGDWNSRYRVQGSDLDGKTLGIVGLGRIGSIVAKIAQPFGMRVIASDPYIDPAIGIALGVQMMSLQDVLRQADFLTLHCPHNDETNGMIDREKLSMLKPGSFFVNLARGGVVKSLDVVDELLGSGHLQGAALDVFNDEPPAPDHPIFLRENCLVSPHSMATTSGAMTRIFKSMTDDMVAVFEGRRPEFVVNPETLS